MTDPNTPQSVAEALRQRVELFERHGFGPAHAHLDRAQRELLDLVTTAADLLHPREAS